MSPTNEIIFDILILLALGVMLYLKAAFRTWRSTRSQTTTREDEIQSDIGVEAHAPGAQVTPKSHDPDYGLGARHRFRFNKLIGYPPDSSQS